MYITHILRYTRLSPLFDEMSLAADSDERKLYRRLLDTRLFYYLHGQTGRFTVSANGEQNQRKTAAKAWN